MVLGHGYLRLVHLFADGMGPTRQNPLSVLLLQRGSIKEWMLYAAATGWVPMPGPLASISAVTLNSLLRGASQFAQSTPVQIMKSRIGQLLEW